MSENDPSSFPELYGWLKRVGEASGSPIPPLPAEHTRWTMPGSVTLWLIQYESDHRAAIEEAAERIWMHGAEVFQDLPPEAGSLLRLRIETAADWIGEFVTTEKTLFPYPEEDFRDLAQWLLERWWELSGRSRSYDAFLIRSVRQRS